MTWNYLLFIKIAVLCRLINLLLNDLSLLWGSTAIRYTSLTLYSVLLSSCPFIYWSALYLSLSVYLSCVCRRWAVIASSPVVPGRITAESVVATAPHAGWYEDRLYHTLHQNNVGDTIHVCVCLTCMSSLTLVQPLHLMSMKLIPNTLQSGL